MAVIQVEAPATIEHGGEVQLLAPVGDDGMAEEAVGPAVHLGSDFFGHFQEERVPREGELEVAVVVEGHGVHLPQRILAIEHPAIGTGKQRVGHVADAGAHVGARLGSRSRALDPLTLEVRRNHRAIEVPRPRIHDGDLGTRDHRCGIEEADPLAAFVAPLPPRCALDHQLPPTQVEGRQRFQGAEDFRGVNIRKIGEYFVTEVQRRSHLDSPEGADKSDHSKLFPPPPCYNPPSFPTVESWPWHRVFSSKI